MSTLWAIVRTVRSARHDWITFEIALSSDNICQIIFRISPWSTSCLLLSTLYRMDYTANIVLTCCSCMSVSLSTLAVASSMSTTFAGDSRALKVFGCHFVSLPIYPLVYNACYVISDMSFTVFVNDQIFLMIFFCVKAIDKIDPIDNRL